MDYARARANMVQRQLRPCGITDKAILNAFASIPRENFVPQDKLALAYSDAPIDMGDGRFLPSPVTHAKLLSIACPTENDVVLAIGAGSGYSTAILSKIVGTVIALEKDPELVKAANKRCEVLDISTIVCSASNNPSDGDKENAPFDVIVINGAVSEIPQNLVEQLSPKGRLVTVLREKGQPIGRGVVVKRIESGGFSSYPEFDSPCPYHSSFAS